MKQELSLVSVVTILSLMLLLSSCQVAGDLFKGGIWVGAIIVIVIVAVILYVIARMGKKN